MKNINDENFCASFAQLNPIPADIEYNKNKLLDAIKNFEENDVELIFTPDLFLYGYCDFCMLNKFPYVLNQINQAIDEIKKNIKKTHVLISYPELNLNNKNIEVSCILLSNDGILKIDDEFILNDKKFYIVRNDEFEKLEDKKDIDYIINLNSIITRTNSEYFKNKKFSEISKKYNCNLIHINQIGAIDELVYDGSSRMYDKNGKIIARAESFKEENYIFDLILGGIVKSIPIGSELPMNIDKFSLEYENDLDRTYNAIILAIRDYFYKNGFKQAILGLSGGLDSAVCAVLVSDALDSKNVLGVSMPSKLTSTGSKTDASELANNLKINFMEIPIKDIQNLMTDKFNFAFNEVSKNWCNQYTNSYTQDNIQARSRATILWGISNEYAQTLPIATSDKSETHMGYSTINGDMTGGYSPISDVTKTKLFALARWMNKNRTEKNAIPISTIEKPPGAELAIDPKTGETLKAEDALMPYEFLDEVIWRNENKHQSIDSMMQDTFIYEKKYKIDNDTKKTWLDKFYRRLGNALYKQYIAPPIPIVDMYSINKIEYRQPIVSKINHIK